MKIQQDTASVYIIYNNDTKRTKIGFSKNPKRRFNDIKSICGCRMQLIYFSYPITNYLEVERNLHALFNGHRYLGEWFSVHHKNPIKRLKTMLADKNKCRIIKWFDNGENATIIANKIGVSRSGVVKYLSIYDRLATKKQTCKTLDRSNFIKPLAKEQIEAMVKRSNRGIRPAR